MKGFTLTELAIVIFILTILSSIFLNYSTFNKTFWTLRDFSRNLNNAFAISSYLAQSTKKFSDNYICAYGVYFQDNNSYETLAFATSTNVCELLLPVTSTEFQNFINSNITNKKYVHLNLEIRSQPLPNLVLSASSSLINITFSDDQNCTPNPNINPPLLFLYFYSNTDLFFLLRQEENWKPVSNPSIYICLTYKKERLKIKLNKVGQFYLIER